MYNPKAAEQVNQLLGRNAFTPLPGPRLKMVRNFYELVLPTVYGDYNSSVEGTPALECYYQLDSTKPATKINVQQDTKGFYFMTPTSKVMVNTESIVYDLVDPNKVMPDVFTRMQGTLYNLIRARHANKLRRGSYYGFYSLVPQVQYVPPSIKKEPSFTAPYAANQPLQKSPESVEASPEPTQHMTGYPRERDEYSEDGYDDSSRSDFMSDGSWEFEEDSNPVYVELRPEEIDGP